MIVKFLVFGVAGTFAELLVTAIKRSIESRRLELTGEASLVLFPFFGLAGFLFPMVAVHMGNVPWYGRGAIYMAIFYVVQLLAGSLLKKIGLCPWSYSSRWSAFGLIRLEDAPMWFLCGLATEWLYPFIKAFAQLM